MFVVFMLVIINLALNVVYKRNFSDICEYLGISESILQVTWMNSFIKYCSGARRRLSNGKTGTVQNKEYKINKYI